MTKTKRFTRRRFLQASIAGGLGLTGFGSFNYVSRSYYQKRLRTLLEERVRNPLSVSLVPEYARTAEQVLVAFDNFWIPPAEQRDERVSEREFEELSDILSAFPDYTTIHMMVGPQRKEGMRQQLATLPPSLRERIQPCALERELSVYWAQDACEPALCNGKKALLMPLCREYERDHPDSVFWNTTLPTLIDFEQIVVPLLFEGGNVIPDTVDGKTYLFVGRNEVGRTQQLYRDLLNISLSERDISNLCQRSFGIDEVVILGPTEEDFFTMFDRQGYFYRQFKEKGVKMTNGAVLYDHQGQPALTLGSERVTLRKGKHQYHIPWMSTNGVVAQSPLLFHIDMAMVTHPNGKVSVVDIQSMTPAEERERIDHYRLLFEMEGKTGSALVRQVDAKVGTDIFKVRHAQAEANRLAETLQQIYGSENVSRLTVTASHARQFQSYTNTSRFRHKEIGTYHAVMPTFPTQERWKRFQSEKEGKLVRETYRLTGKEEKYEDSGSNRFAREHFQQQGYVVHPIRNTTYLHDGNVNCVVNVLC